MIFVSDRNKRRKTHARKVVEVSTLLLGNDKNNVIANKVLNYF